MPSLRYASKGDSWSQAQKALRNFSPGQCVNLTVEVPANKPVEPSTAPPADGPGVRYSIVVVDRAERVRKQPLAAFIVPIGREHEWMFSSREGQDQLVNDAGFSRLAIVTMHRGQTYASLDVIKEELSPLVPKLIFSDSGVRSP